MKTMGIVVVAALAAITAGVLVAAITFTLRWTQIWRQITATGHFGPPPSDIR